MKIEKLTLPAASDRRAYDIADMIDIILDDLHAEVSTADDWMEIVRMDIETFCPDATFEKVDRWQEN